MNNAAFTMVQNDMVILELWLKYYSRYFEYLWVIGNGTKEEYGDLQGLREKYGFNFERLEGFAGNSEHTAEIVKDKQKKLLQKHEWVLYSDCDEIIVPDWKIYKDLKGFMAAYPGDKVVCIGYEVFQAENEHPIDYSYPYFKQRQFWFKDPDYNKPLLSKVPLNWAPGCHRELEIEDQINKKMENTGLFLVHLKYSDPDAQRDFGPTRTHIEGGKVEEGKKNREEIPEYVRNLL